MCSFKGREKQKTGCNARVTSFIADVKNLPAHCSLKRPAFQSLMKKMVYVVSKEIGSKPCFAIVYGLFFVSCV